jgi:transposase
MHYIGMDTHITTLDFAVIDDTGRLTRSQSIPTSAQGLIKFIKQVPPPRTIYMEEGSLAAWALEVCVRYGEQLVITDPKQNHWIGSSGQKADPLDAHKLALLARGGYIKAIHHPLGQRRQFRELMQAYHDSVRRTTRLKNQIKAKFRQHGIACTGSTIFNPTHWSAWQQQLPQETSLQLILSGLYRQLEQSEQSEAEILQAAHQLANHFPEIRLLDAVPGMGFIHAATVSAILETPYRFANKRKVWMYAGLGINTRSSGGKLYSEKLTTDYNRLLKYVFKQAAEAAIRSRDNPFRQQYLDLTLIRGVVPHRAKLTIARSLAATLWAIWKNGTKYNPEVRVQAHHKQD